MKVNLGNEEYTIKFGFKPTLKSHLIKDVVSTENNQSGDDFDAIEKLLLETLPKMLLVGLQVHHADKFGYDYETDEGFEDKLAEVLDLLSEKIDSNEINCLELFNQLETELEDNSFLAQMMEKERKEQSPKKTPSKTTK